MSADRSDDLLSEAFDEDYLHFYSSWHEEEIATYETDLIAELLDLPAGREVLDHGCGTGRIAVRLAERGLKVTGIDQSDLFLDEARREAERLGVEANWIRQDVRDFDAVETFDGLVSWFTSFGYFDDAADQDILARMVRSLRPGGRLLLETGNAFQVAHESDAYLVTRRGPDWMLDHVLFDAASGRRHYERTVVRKEKPSRTFRFALRTFTLTELRAWLEGAGLTDVDGFDEKGAPFHVEAERLIVTATKPRS